MEREKFEREMEERGREQDKIEDEKRKIEEEQERKAQEEKRIKEEEERLKREYAAAHPEDHRPCPVCGFQLEGMKVCTTCGVDVREFEEEERKKSEESKLVANAKKDKQDFRQVALKKTGLLQ